ncbi:PLP-dependent transferase [Streptacidiphilus jiangxiensis]|uniref:PLP-dependent transferase n=1 Tax=Streptacidiphilus jiangxiensis TaxID=235985 RepID=UPI000693AA28|nr:PLP-dependent transferase [Streptacidiphilus jiangxiensis]
METTASPSVSPVEQRLAQLHGADTALLAPSAVAAVSAALLALSNPGGHVIASRYAHGPVGDFLRDGLPRMGREVTFVDCADLDEVAAAIRPTTQVVFAESLSRPLMLPCPVNDLAPLAQTNDLLLVVDNTALSPALLRPLDLGAAVVVEDCGPYLDGHGDLNTGLVAGPRRLMHQIKAQAAPGGAGIDPWSGRLLDRSLDTLGLRMTTIQANADRVAVALRDCPAVTAVHRPSFDEHPWALETHDGFGGLLAFETELPAAEVAALVQAVNGDATTREAMSTLALVPAATTHAALSERQREAMGAHRGLISIAVGIEDPGPLIRRLTRALDRAHSVHAAVDGRRTPIGTEKR